MQQSIAKSPRRGFTLIELLIVIAIIALLAAILFPVFSRVRENARKASCQSNLKQIATAFHQYLQDYDGRYPQGQDLNVDPGVLHSSNRTTPAYATFVQTNPGDVNAPVLWPAKMEPYLKSRQIFTCPSAKTRIRRCTETGSYAVAVDWKGSDPVWPNALNVTYGYNTFYLGGGVHVNQSPPTGTYWRGCQNSNAPSTTTCYNCGIGAAEAEIAESASTLLLVDNSFQFRTTGISPAFAHLDISLTPGDDDMQCSATGAADDFDSFDPRHNGGLNVAFADGHVKWMKKPDAQYKPVGYSCATGYNSLDPKFIWNRF